MEEPYIPYYQPFGMSDEEFKEEVKLAEERYFQWLAEQEAEQEEIDVWIGIAEQEEREAMGFQQAEEDILMDIETENIKRALDDLAIENEKRAEKLKIYYECIGKCIEHKCPLYLPNRSCIDQYEKGAFDPIQTIKK